MSEDSKQVLELELECLLQTSSLRSDAWRVMLGFPVSLVLKRLNDDCQWSQKISMREDRTSPTSGDIVVDLVQQGMVLTFDAGNERLRRIELNDMSKVRLVYSSFTFNLLQDGSPATMSHVVSVLGSPHWLKKDGDKYLLRYPYLGLEFGEPLPRTSRDSEPLTPESSQLRRMILSTEPRDAKAPPPPLPLEHLPRAVFLERVDVRREKGRNVSAVDFWVHYWNMSQFGEQREFHTAGTLCFGDSCQKVISALGAAGDIFQKSELPSAAKAPVSQHGGPDSDSLLNYFHLGIDILIDGRTKTVKKFVFHTNFFNHEEFGWYWKCHFTIYPEERDEESIGRVITSDSKWDVIRKMLPMEKWPSLDPKKRYSPSEDPTAFFGYKNMVFEVRPDDRIQKFILFLLEEAPTPPERLADAGSPPAPGNEKKPDESSQQVAGKCAAASSTAPTGGTQGRGGQDVQRTLGESQMPESTAGRVLKDSARGAKAGAGGTIQPQPEKTEEQVSEAVTGARGVEQEANTSEAKDTAPRAIPKKSRSKSRRWGKRH